ncbi:MAG: oxidoreductase, partial [Pseudomonadota bacterium]
RSGAVDMVGMARAMVLDPRMAETWSSSERNDPEFPRFESAPPGGITAWFTMRLTALGENREEEFRLDLPAAIREYEERDAQRCVRWRKAFSQ